MAETILVIMHDCDCMLSSYKHRAKSRREENSSVNVDLGSG
jgi:hypothetical protein